MTQSINNMNQKVLVAIDIAKDQHDVLIKWPDGRKKRMKLANKKENFVAFVS